LNSGLIVCKILKNSNFTVIRNQATGCENTNRPRNRNSSPSETSEMPIQPLTSFPSTVLIHLSCPVPMSMARISLPKWNFAIPFHWIGVGWIKNQITFDSYVSIQICESVFSTAWAASSVMSNPFPICVISSFECSYTKPPSPSPSRTPDEKQMIPVPSNAMASAFAYCIQDTFKFHA
jgi:hypothetical protein